jgi:2-polyprenyl-3-methyl-5-hydroxy-6-metoxy-1,4-benzoquinol methylase
MRILKQLNVPANQNLVYQDENLARNAVVGDLDIYCDDDTGFIYNRAFDINKLDYSPKYDSNPYHSPYFKAYIDTQTEWLQKNYIPSDASIVEVGCGKGFYLKQVAEKLPGCKAYGFDTSYVFDNDDNPENPTFLQEYYNEAYAYLNPDVVISRHVIEHISEPVEFLQQIRKTMNEGSILFLETPDVDWILKNNVIFDFFYEHCSYWNKTSLDWALRLSGFEMLEASNQFNGQYLWVVAKATNKDCARVCQNRNMSQFIDLCRQFTNNREKEIDKVAQSLQYLKEKSSIVVWGAGAKGVTFVNLFDPNKYFVSYVVDINPAKQQKYIGKTGHKVISVNELKINALSGGGGDHPCIKY